MLLSAVVRSRPTSLFVVVDIWLLGGPELGPVEGLPGGKGAAEVDVVAPVGGGCGEDMVFDITRTSLCPRRFPSR